MIQRLLACLLHCANQSPPFNRSAFYDLKKRLLNRYGTYDGDDIQHVANPCWGAYDWHSDSYEDCGPTCRKCGGTGIFSESWHVLRRYVWCGYKFHVPNHRLYSAPTYDGYVNKIEGRIEHRSRGRIHAEAALWLYLLCGELRLFWREMKGSRAHGWVWFPLLNIQKITMEVSMLLHRRRCWCGKWFWTWGSGWQICKGCRRPRVESEESESVPF